MARRSRRRRWIILPILILLLGAALWALFRPPAATIGQWRSAEGQEVYRAAYAAAMEALPEPAEVRDLRSPWGLVRLYRFAGAGGGEALLLLPGTASGTPVWADNLPGLLEIADVYTLDLLGEPGLSIQERPITSAADKAAWLDAVLAALPEAQVHVVGLSIGGWTAANLAIHRPDHVASVTLIDPVFVFDSIPLGTMIRAGAATLPWAPEAWRDSFNAYTAGGAEVEDVPVADMIAAGMAHYAMRQPPPARIDAAALSAAPVQILAILAGQSVMHRPEEARAAAEALADAVRVYPEASHAINGEHPAEIAADIAAFLASLD
ncbi:alpha/beta fold hydrolase [Pseudoroseicyclus sp. CXY001]|uniref:alpha/beta fold hydrolase n=1 Tax=Pseudoroseicyclus sp. CXY001 TaxID=3242492 RepID=UPI00358DB19F